MFYWRTMILALAFTAAFTALGLRLYQLQVWETDRYREMGRQRTHRL
jgi:cell division protein FtsI/penicillin-binding protein 2